MIELNKTQQKCFDALRYNPMCQKAFLAVCEANGRKWKTALLKQFGTDANVCFIDNDLLPYIRQIRNKLSLLGLI